MNKKIADILALILIILIITLSIVFLANQKNGISQPKLPVAEEKKQEEVKDKKTLVVYFSRSGNTEKVATYIKERINADILELEPIDAYPTSYNEMLEKAKDEKEKHARPKIKNIPYNLDDYDKIFLGYPIWWGDCPMLIYTFLEKYDLSGKSVIPFVTSGGSGLSSTPENIQNTNKNIKVLQGLEIDTKNIENLKQEVDRFLEEYGYLN